MRKFVQKLCTTMEWAFVGGPNKPKMAAAAIFNFGKISITLD